MSRRAKRSRSDVPIARTLDAGYRRASVLGGTATMVPVGGGTGTAVGSPPPAPCVTRCP